MGAQGKFLEASDCAFSKGKHKNLRFLENHKNILFFSGALSESKLKDFQRPLEGFSKGFSQVPKKQFNDI